MAGFNTVRPPIWTYYQSRLLLLLFILSTGVTIWMSYPYQGMKKEG